MYHTYLWVVPICTNTAYKQIIFKLKLLMLVVLYATVSGLMGVILLKKLLFLSPYYCRKQALIQTHTHCELSVFPSDHRTNEPRHWWGNQKPGSRGNYIEISSHPCNACRLFSCFCAPARLKAKLTPTKQKRKDRERFRIIHLFYWSPLWNTFCTLTWQEFSQRMAFLMQPGCWGIQTCKQIDDTTEPPGRTKQRWRDSWLEACFSYLLPPVLAAAANWLAVRSERSLLG